VVDATFQFSMSNLPDQPLVSICVPTFQHSAYIKNCLESIVAQETNFPFEILVGEDCSTDGTREICIEYAERFPDRIRLFLRRDEEKMILLGKKTGRSNHLKLYESARGKYICFCDGDDYWCDTQKLQKQVRIMESNATIMLCTTNTRIEGSISGFPIGLPETDVLFDPKELRNKFYLGHISSWMVRNHMKEILANPIVRMPVYLDLVFFLFYRLKGKVYYLSDITSVYNFNPNGIYRGNSEKENHKALYRKHWLLFRYLHRDPILFLRAIFYTLRRGVDIFLLRGIKKLWLWKN
jgi:glycosyltransferase involved in cell wall biosynthesis